jgi:hypothetical protein
MHDYSNFLLDFSRTQHQQTDQQPALSKMQNFENTHHENSAFRAGRGLAVTQARGRGTPGVGPPSFSWSGRADTIGR